MGVYLPCGLRSGGPKRAGGKMRGMKPWSDQEARWIRRAAEDVISERRPLGHEFTAEEKGEVNRLMVNRRLAAEARDLETYRIVHGQLVRLYVGSYTRWVLGRRRGAGRAFVPKDELLGGGPQANIGRRRRWWT